MTRAIACRSTSTCGRSVTDRWIVDRRKLIDMSSAMPVLTAEGFVWETPADSEQVAYMAADYPLDLAVLDLGLPKASGIEIIKRTRKAGKSFPILILTARDAWQSKVEALEAGADDYLVKPFHREELIARARALLRRAGGWAKATLDSGPIALDTSSKSVTVSGEAVELTSYE